MQEMWVQSLNQEDSPGEGNGNPLEKGMATRSTILAGKSDGQRSLAGYSPWGHEDLNTTEQLVLSSTIGRATCFTQCTD